MTYFGIGEINMNSKWSYTACGANAAVALVGALLHNGTLLIVGLIFTVWNWYAAEYNRSREDESIRKSVTNTGIKSETEE